MSPATPPATVENNVTGYNHEQGNLAIILSGKAKSKDFGGELTWLGQKYYRFSEKTLKLSPEPRDISAEILSKIINASPNTIAQIFPYYSPKSLIF